MNNKLERPINGTAVEIRGLSYTYPDGNRALSGVDLDVTRGESLGIAGPNGAGKTTLLLHLNGILSGGAGGIRVLGMTVNKENLRAIRSRVGLVFQDPDDQLFSPTVFDDVSFGPLSLGLPRDEVLERTEKALAMVGLEGYGRKTSHHLSTGEKKKAALATVLSLDCELLALDEPTANLDPRSRARFAELLRTLGPTKIIASHDLELIRCLCSRVVILDNGAITADGRPDEVFSDRAVIGRYRENLGF